MVDTIEGIYKAEILNITTIKSLKEDVKGKHKTKLQQPKFMRSKRKKNIMHGQYVRNMDDKFIEKKWAQTGLLINGQLNG
jgi:hypothetical protein